MARTGVCGIIECLWERPIRDGPISVLVALDNANDVVALWTDRVPRLETDLIGAIEERDAGRSDLCVESRDDGLSMLTLDVGRGILDLKFSGVRGFLYDW